MLAKLVSNSWPCDLPVSAYKSTGITGVSHHAWWKPWIFIWILTSACQFPQKNKIWDFDRDCVNAVDLGSHVILFILSLPIHGHRTSCHLFRYSLFFIFFFFFFKMESHTVLAQSQLTATSTSQVQAILLAWASQVAGTTGICATMLS